MAKCDTCALLAVPDNPDHAKHYRICTWTAPMPANALYLERSMMERQSARWITAKVVNEQPEKMIDPTHTPRKE